MARSDAIAREILRAVQPLAIDAAFVAERETKQQIDELDLLVRPTRANRKQDLADAEKLHLRVNEPKSVVARVQERKFLGYTFWLSSKNEFRCMIASKALEVMKERVRRMTSRMRGRSLAQICKDLRAYLPGWKAYFRLVELASVFRELDAWIRHRLRALQLKHWRHGPTIFRELYARGMSPRDARRVAGSASRYWHNSRMLINFAMPNKLFDELGLPRLAT